MNYHVICLAGGRNLHREGICSRKGKIPRDVGGTRGVHSVDAHVTIVHTKIRIARNTAVRM